ncbi:hypothetical protein HanHA300_Chr04g0152261 [Helianthus annuus]|nr:hypothetical protein HanHA300_Chr04g0152261 [Helianthus annuus]KAJ0598421.1 hypothetical protein HanHA89_Chr04g0165621 [Helianthus annuus]KAJ0759025.1 hypothetical protein HanLR1_Chr04g0156941 [Helianthus annuus]
MYIPKNFYPKTTYITRLSEKFGGSGAPPSPLKAAPMVELLVVMVSFSQGFPILFFLFPQCINLCRFIA